MGLLEAGERVVGEAREAAASIKSGLLPELPCAWVAMPSAASTTQDWASGARGPCHRATVATVKPAPTAYVDRASGGSNLGHEGRHVDVDGKGRQRQRGCSQSD